MSVPRTIEKIHLHGAPRRTQGSGLREPKFTGATRRKPAAAPPPQIAAQIEQRHRPLTPTGNHQALVKMGAMSKNVEQPKLMKVLERRRPPWPIVGMGDHVRLGTHRHQAKGESDGNKRVVKVLPSIKGRNQCECVKDVRRFTAFLLEASVSNMVVEISETRDEGFRLVKCK